MKEEANLLENLEEMGASKAQSIGTFTLNTDRVPE